MQCGFCEMNTGGQHEYRCHCFYLSYNLYSQSTPSEYIWHNGYRYRLDDLPERVPGLHLGSIRIVGDNGYWDEDPTKWSDEFEKGGV